ncbi:MAG: hypothetical protein ACREJ2_17195 [Planctomycetota bacterium]
MTLSDDTATFRAPRAFFLSDYLPPVCVVTGHTEGLTRMRVAPRTPTGRKRSDPNLSLELFFHPAGLRAYTLNLATYSWLVAIGLLLVGLWLISALGPLLDPLMTAIALVVCVTGSFGAGWLVPHLRHTREPIPRIQFDDATQTVVLIFAPARADLAHPFNQAHTAWIAAGGPPRRKPRLDPAAPAEESWAGDSGAWDEKKS